MKKFFSLLCLIVCLTVQSGCKSEFQDLSYMDDDMSSSTKKEFDVSLVTVFVEDLIRINEICDNYEYETGVKVKVDVFEENDYIVKLKESIANQQAPSLFFTYNVSDLESLEKLGVVMDLYKSNNTELQSELDKIQANFKFLKNQSECYGVILSSDREDEDFPKRFISVNSKVNDLEKKLSLDFLQFLLSKYFDNAKS